MKKTYRLVIHNESTYTGQIIVFQEKPQSDIVPDQIFTLAWRSVRIYPNQSVVFEWTLDYAFVWSTIGNLQPGMRFTAAELAPIESLSPPIKNRITLAQESQHYIFTNQEDGHDGNLSIVSDPKVVPGQAAVGFSVSGTSAFAVQARPNFPDWFIPQPSYVVALGAYQQGDVMDLDLLAAPNRFEFPVGITELVFTYNADGTWTQSPGAPAASSDALATSPAAPSYYQVVLGTNIPHGSGILGRPCKVVFTYPGGSHSDPYAGTVFSWPTQNTIQMQSPYMNIQAAWVGANGGTLSIDATGGTLNFPIVGFTNVTTATDTASADKPPTAPVCEV